MSELQWPPVACSLLHACLTGMHGCECHCCIICGSGKASNKRPGSRSCRCVHDVGATCHPDRYGMRQESMYVCSAAHMLEPRVTYMPHMTI